MATAVAAVAAVAATVAAAVTEAEDALSERGDTATTTAVSSRTTFSCYPATGRPASRLRYFAGARRREIVTPVHVAARHVARALIDCPPAKYFATLQQGYLRPRILTSGVTAPEVWVSPLRPFQVYAHRSGQPMCYLAHVVQCVRRACTYAPVARTPWAQLPTRGATLR